MKKSELRQLIREEISKVVNEDLNESLNKRRVKFKGKTINDLYNIIKVSPDSLVFSDGIFYSIGDIEELRNDLKSKTIYLQTKDGDEVEKDVQDIEFIEIN